MAHRIWSPTWQIIWCADMRPQRGALAGESACRRAMSDAFTEASKMDRMRNGDWGEQSLTDMAFTGAAARAKTERLT